MSVQTYPPFPANFDRGDLHHEPAAPSMKLAGFWIRLIAYTVDIIPMTFAVAVCYYCFFGFDVILERFVEARNEVGVRADFIAKRNEISNVTFLCYLVYCVLLEASPLRGTIGKWLLGLQVVDANGHRLSFARSLSRSLGKIISYVVLCLGFLWVLCSDKKQGWHDMIAKSYVVKNR